MFHRDQVQISISWSSDITCSSDKHRIFIFVDMAICFQRLTRLFQISAPPRSTQHEQKTIRLILAV